MPWMISVWGNEEADHPCRPCQRLPVLGVKEVEIGGGTGLGVKSVPRDADRVQHPKD